MKCPKCGMPIELIKETDWDSLVTYMWLHCFYCGWHSEQPFTDGDLGNSVNITEITTRMNGGK